MTLEALRRLVIDAPFVAGFSAAIHPRSGKGFLSRRA
jgi:hypothetical protein